MKFLTIGTVKDVFYTLSQAQQNRLMVSTLEYGLQFKKKMSDKIDFYIEAGWGRIVSISEFNSVEEYYQSLQSPMAQAGFLNYESYPLIDMDEKAFEAALASLKAAK